MSSIQKQYYDFIISMIVNQKTIDECFIDDVMTQLRSLPMFTPLTDEDVFHTKARITSERSIHLDAGSLIEEKKHAKWFLSRKANLDMTYWNRYKKYLVHDKYFQPSVVNSMDDILDTLTDLLGDPEKTSYSRKGLIVGDVQSGKTANYTGLICKAADAKYKVIVLLTGTIESLRKQTQMRLDEGFVGWDSSAMVKKLDSNDIGAGKYDPSIHPVVLTSTLDDFKAQTAKNINFNLQTINQPVLFVVKKNISVLRRLNQWLRTFNQNGENKIDTSILVIDDEADNASVNTNPEDKDPAAINKQIKQLVNVFTKSSYVGFTATPYANIFIDPYTNDQMENEDLFPKDYIYALNAPSNYIGARDVFDPLGKHKYMCVKFDKKAIEDLEKLIPSVHKNGFIVEELPFSMLEAIAAFFVGNAIRDLRGDHKAHRSMLINISRFNNVQKQVYDQVNIYLKAVQESVRVYGGLSLNEARKNSQMEFLEKMFLKHYREIEYTWEDIQPCLHRAIASINLVMVNQSSPKGLDYDEYPDGMRVIAIGGLSLSRGLTLEGLMTSYFHRNSKTYDTLMQMGRWFGYRPKYADLCRIWMSESSYEWYRHISSATDELRNDIKRYEDSGLTPLDFGLRVRSDINTLLVTARNKMRTAGDRICTISLSEECIETPDLYISEVKNRSNFEAVERFRYSIKSHNYYKRNENTVIFKGVAKELVLNILSQLELPISNETFETEAISEFLREYRGKELDCWDVAFAGGLHAKALYEVDEETTIQYKERSFSVINNETIIRISGSKRRLGSVSDGSFAKEDISSKNLLSKIINDTSIKRKTIRQNDYFKYRYIGDRAPLLVIYPIVLSSVAKTVFGHAEQDIASKYVGKRLIGFGIGIPRLKDEKSKYVKYTLNKVAQMLSSEYDIGDEE